MGRKRKLICLGIIGISILSVSLLATLVIKTSKRQGDFYEVTSEETNIKRSLHGNWKGMLQDGTDIQITYSNTEDKLLLSSNKGKFYNYEVTNWSIDNKEIRILAEHRCSNIEYVLMFKDEENLEGSYIKNEQQLPITLERITGEPQIKPFYSEEFNYQIEDKMQELNKNSLYEKDNLKYQFTYDIKNQTKYQKFIETYQLNEVVKGKEDVELMRAMLVWVGKKCPHNGGVGMPEVYTPENIMQTCKENGGINARGLSILLAELLRAYGIKARAVTCMPSNDLVTECNVVVEAYSERLAQWIMLDPTYRLILKNDKKEYVNLRMLRNSIRDGEVLFPNEEASRNGEKFNLEEYVYYMSKNVFRFSSPENLYYGAEEGRDGNRSIELVPKGYETPRIEKQLIVITTDDDQFWAKP